jgi:hypothetical protein
MKVPIDIQMMKGGMIAHIYLDDESGVFERKWDAWTQVYPFRDPARGQIGFNFHKWDNHLIGVQIYYAKFCLPERYSEYSEYFPDGEPIKTMAYVDPALLYIYVSEDSGRNSMCQAIHLASPAQGVAVLDFHRDSLLRGIELIGCNHRFSPKPAIDDA